MHFAERKPDFFGWIRQSLHPTLSLFLCLSLPLSLSLSFLSLSLSLRLVHTHAHNASDTTSYRFPMLQPGSPNACISVEFTQSWTNIFHKIFWDGQRMLWQVQKTGVDFLQPLWKLIFLHFDNLFALFKIKDKFFSKQNMNLNVFYSDCNF